MVERNRRIFSDGLTNTMKMENCDKVNSFVDYIMSKIRKYQDFKDEQTFMKKLFDWGIIDGNNLYYLEVELTRVKFKSVEIFLKYKFHTVVKDKCGQDLMACLFGNSDPKVIKLLKNEKIDVNGHAGFHRKTSLHYAAENGVHENVTFLLERGADPDALDSYCKPLLRTLFQMSFCIVHGMSEKLESLEQCFKLLLQTGGNLLMTDSKMTSTIFNDIFQPHSPFDNFCINTLNVLIAHVATYHALEIPIKKYDTMFPLKISAIYDIQAVRSFYKKCREQLELLKSYEVGEIYRDKRREKISMMTILAEDPRKIARFIKKKHQCTIAQLMNNCKEKTLDHYYHDTLEEHIKIISKINYCRWAAARFISECSGILDSYHLVIQHIVDYLTFNDLLSFE